MSDTGFLGFLFCWLPLILLVVYLGIVFFMGNQTKNKEAQRVEDIKSRSWGDFQNNVIDREVKPGMTEEMVLMAWGKPDGIDKQVETEKYSQERWVYGQPRKGSGANYVTLRDGMVSKVVTNTPPQVSTQINRGAIIGGLFVIWIVLIIVLLLAR